MKYLVLLRGINVGGHNKVVMKELKASLAAADFTNVSSYINSGNLIFESDLSKAKVAQKIDLVLAENYIFPITTLVISAEEYLQEFSQLPAWWGADDSLRHNALFLLPNFDVKAFQKITQQISDYDQIELKSKVIFWTSTFKKDFSKSVYSKLMKEALYKDVTIRNLNTALKLLQLLQD